MVKKILLSYFELVLRGQIVCRIYILLLHSHCNYYDPLDDADIIFEKRFYSVWILYQKWSRVKFVVIFELSGSWIKYTNLYYNTFYFRHSSFSQTGHVLNREYFVHASLWIFGLSKNLARINKAWKYKDPKVLELTVMPC